MARDFSPRKRRSKSFLPPQQKFISQFFTPRSGISKEAVNFLVKPEKKARENSNLAFKETKGKLSLVKQDIDSTVSTGNLDQITSSPVAFTSARDIWRSQQSSTGELKEGNLYNNTVISTASSPTSSSSQPEKLEQNSITDFFHLGARGSYKQTLDTRVSSMKSSTNSTSLNSSSVRKSKKREHDHESSSKKRKLDRRKNAPPWPAIVSLDSEESDGDCRIVGVVHGTQTQGIDKEESIDAGCRDVDVSNKQEGACTNTTSQNSTSKSNRQTCSSTSKQSSRSTFGLVGKDSGESDDDLEDSDVNIASLPVEIMENIFCQLPVVDLMLNCVMVCHKWHDIIASESFIPWKKTYFRLKSRVSSCEDKINELLDRNQLLELDLFPLHLARFMSNFKRRMNPLLLLSLRQHSKFHLIASFLETCTSEPDKDPCPWSAASLLILVSQTVYEVQEIMNCLVKSNCCLVQDILECFYCLASIFFVLETQNRIGSGPHYRVFYSLYLFENAFEATCASLGSVFHQNSSGQQSLMRYRSASDRLQLTHEQVRIIKHDVSAGEIIKIVAFAGTGKTTTLIEYTKMRPMQKFLNVAYNKSIQEHAEKSFPRNVESRTVHSLAFRGVGYKYRHKLAPSLRLSAIMNVLPDQCGYLHARRVEDTLKNFIASTSDVVNKQHVPAVSRAAVGDGSSSGSSDSGKAIFGNHGANLEYLNSEKHIQNVVSHAELLWERMKDLGDREIPITHDGYLKVYQLSRPTLFGYDCLLIDEAQDCTPAASDVLLRQRCAKILVGDPHQQIYAFRGARNALQEVTGTHTFYLTQSFRFGPEIAYVAACVLDVLKGVRHKTLVGGAKPGSVLGERKGQLCIITRCNYTLFNEAVHVCCSKNSTRVAFVGGIKGLALDRVLDIHKLFTAGSNNGRLDIKDNLIKKFHSFAELKKYAKAASDAELLGKIKIVETHHVMLQLRIEKIKSKTCHNMQQADIVFSTAHKAKGLEFDTVRLTDDFLPGREMGMSIHEHQEDEKNLVYVAVSRAKKCLQLTTTVLNILREKKEHFLKLVSPTETSQHNASPVCVSCMDADDVSPRPPHVIVRKEDVILGGNIRMSGGVLGPSCALTQIPHLGCLVNPTLVKVKEPESEYEFEFEFE